VEDCPAFYGIDFSPETHHPQGPKTFRSLIGDCLIAGYRDEKEGITSPWIGDFEPGVASFQLADGLVHRGALWFRTKFCTSFFWCHISQLVVSGLSAFAEAANG